MLKKIESQLLSYNGKDKLTVDEYYNVLKVQVLAINGGNIKHLVYRLLVV